MQGFFNGYAGKQLRVLLDEKKVKVESLNPNILKKYIGGVGYAAKILYDELIKNTNPLGPNNKIIFATGPLTAYNVPGGGSIELCF
jgi:aldehyde:ferredoxin oxidoreductase